MIYVKVSLELSWYAKFILLLRKLMHIYYIILYTSTRRLTEISQLRRSK